MRIVRQGENCFGNIFADFRPVDVEGGTQLDIPDVIATELHIHQARNRHIAARLGVVAQPLHEGRRAIADADNANPELALAHATLSLSSASIRLLELRVPAEIK